MWWWPQSWRVDAASAMGALAIDDERLAARVACDATAFAELHARYEQPLLRYVRSLLRDPHDAADAAQDAWTRALVALRESPGSVASVRSWLFAIARNACMDRLRDRKRCAPAEIDERALGASPAPDDVLELRSRAREALGDVAGLSERQRAAVVLRDLVGLEGEDLARALRTDARRASWLLTDARRSLAQAHAGRGLSCETTRHQLDSARVRTRAVRAHLAGCPECDGYARRRVARRVHLHGIALLVLALPARLRAFATKPSGAIAAAALVAGAPAVHELHQGGRPHAILPPAPVLSHRAAAPAVTLPAAPKVARRHVRARSVVAVRHGTPRAAAQQVRAAAPAWKPAHENPPSPAAAAPAPAARVRAAAHRVADTVTRVAPVVAPAVGVVTGALDAVRVDL
jgi:RNA polymerase sigma-70 factor (ECF subfamily)